MADDTPDKRRNVAENVDVCEHRRAAAQEVGREGPAGKHAQGGVEDGVACGVVDGGKDALHGVGECRTV